MHGLLHVVAISKLKQLYQETHMINKEETTDTSVVSNGLVRWDSPGTVTSLTELVI